MIRPTPPNSTPRSSYGRFARLSLTAVAMGVHAMCASAETESEAPNKTRPGDQDKRVEFDIETLKARGLDPALAEYFAQKPRFAAGVHRVGLFVNGTPRGTANLRFDAEGKLCFDRELILKARLVMPDALKPAAQWSILDSILPSANEAGKREGVQPIPSNQPDDGVLHPFSPRPVRAVSESAPVATTATPATSAEGDAAAAAQPELATPEAPPAGAPNACYDYRTFQPQTEAETDAERNEVRIVVPAESIARPTPGDTATKGGVGTMLNYNLMFSGNQSGGSSRGFFYGDTTAGFNAGDWIVRSQQNYWVQGGQSEFQMPFVYGQKTFASTGYMAQVGQIAINNPVVGGTPIEGVQILPDTALSPSDNGGVIEGVAQEQSRVEIRQAGLLIYTTMVPAGPFALSGVPLVDGTSLIEVTLVGSSNNTRSFTVSPASLGIGRTAPQGLSLAAGRVYQYRAPDAMARPLVVSAAKGWNIGKLSNLSAGALMSTRYQAAGLSTSVPVLNNAVTVGTNAVVSNVPRDGDKGASLGLSLSARLPQSLSLSVSGSRQTPGFRSLSDTLYDTPDSIKNNVMWNIMRSFRVRDTVSASLNWNHDVLGAFSLSYSRFGTYLGFSGQRASASWSRQFGDISASLSLDRALGSGSGGTSTLFYASVSIPLGKVRTSSYLNNSSGKLRGGVTASQTINEYASYNVGMERGEGSGTERFYGALSLRPRYAQASISASAQQGGGSLSGQIQGSVAATKEGAVFSPYPIGDTFGVISAGDLSGVAINTSSGTVWTDWRGKALISDMPAYQPSTTTVKTKTLPRNVDIKNGYAEMEAGRGSVSFVDLGVVKVRRVLLNVAMDDGSKLPADSSIRDGKDDYVTTAVDNGMVFLDNEPNSELSARTPDGGRCVLKFRLTNSPDLNVPFEHADATCDRVPA